MYKTISLQLNILKSLKLIISFLGLLIFVSCNQQENESKDIILATVGNEQITVQDFRRNYEFGLPHLKSEPNRKLSYLTYMINEKVLALEGYNLGFDNSEKVKILEQRLLDELLIEELFSENVNSKIEIKPDEVEQAILKSKVSWKMSFWFEKEKEQADFIHHEMNKNGFKNTVSKILRFNPEVKLQEKDFETDYITWLELAPEILEKIKDLSVHDISEPIKLDGGYYIFQIQDLRREPITDFNLKDQYERFRQILYYRKLKDEAGKYVVSVMRPKKVVTSGKTLYELTKVYMAWKQDTTKLKFRDFVTEQRNNLLSKSLVTFSQENWNVLDFLKKFDLTKIDDKIFNKEKIGGEISKQVALKVRDEVLTKLALENDLDKNKNVQKQMKEWRDKWTYDETRRYYLKEIMISDEDAEKYFNKNIKFFQTNFDEPPKYEDYKNTAKRFTYIQQAGKILVKKIDSLKVKYPININSAVLDTITSIDFEKSRWQSLQVFKRSTNRLAVPIVDPAWKIQ